MTNFERTRSDTRSACYLNQAIARALDLAVELGFERISEVQENILCEAAHVPVIWATQFLPGMVEQGAPRRPEATDAAMEQRPEGVILNKDHSSLKQGVSSAMCCAGQIATGRRRRRGSSRWRSGWDRKIRVRRGKRGEGDPSK